MKHRDGDHAVLEASLLDADDALLASATAIARVIGLDAAGARSERVSGRRHCGQVPEGPGPAWFPAA